MKKKDEEGYIFPLKYPEFMGFYKSDPVKSFILWLLYSEKFGDEIQQSDIIHYCRQQFALTLHGSSNATVFAKLGELEEEKKYRMIPLLKSRSDGRNKIYFIPDIVDIMLPWGTKLGFGGTIIIIAIVSFLSFLLPDTWMETISFGNNPPVVVYRWFVEPYGLILITALSTLWLSILAQYAHSRFAPKKA